jgi:RNA polymerase sigma-70 factor (ECF subfamily)
MLRDGGGSEPGVRSIVYCLVPRELAPRLHEQLRRHFRDDPEVRVIVEQRGRERRLGGERRRRPADGGEPGRPDDRRRIPGASGRRVGGRRASLVRVDAPPLPRRASPYAQQLAFVERFEPTDLRAEDLDTARLVTRIQAGDRDGFAVLYMRYFDRVYAYLRLLLRDANEAEDVAQQVFLKLLSALGRYDRREQPFRAWLFVVVRNCALNHLRDTGRMTTLDPADLDRRREAELPAPDLDALEWVSDSELLLLIERLPLAQRQVLMLRYMLDLTPREIAQLTNMSPNHVSVLQYRALTFLRRRLIALGRDPRSGERIRVQRVFRKAPVLRRRRYVLTG